MTPAEAQTQIRSMLDETAAAVADGLPVKPMPEELAASACLSNFGKDLGTRTFPYRVGLGIAPDTDIPALFQRTAAHWEAEGYAVEDVDLPESRLPSLHAERGDFGVVLRVDRKLVTAFIDGSTPCVNDPGRDSG